MSRPRLVPSPTVIVRLETGEIVQLPRVVLEGMGGTEAAGTCTVRRRSVAVNNKRAVEREAAAVVKLTARKYKRRA